MAESFAPEERKVTNGTWALFVLDHFCASRDDLRRVIVLFFHLHLFWVQHTYLSIENL